MNDFAVRTPDGAVLAADRSGEAGGTAVVLLHAGVADRRSWRQVLPLLDQRLDAVAVDRRGYGDSPAGEGDFTHLADLWAVLDAVGAERAVLVGNSMGGGIALDAALTRPDRVAGLVLIGSAASGMTDEGEPVQWQADPATAALLEASSAAEAAGDLEEQVRLELHLWLDGPTEPEGRVGGPARELAADMNRRALQGGAGRRGDADLDAWHALARIETPGLAVWGDLDMPPDRPFYELMAERLPNVEGRVLPGVAHLPSLEQPQTVADLVHEVVRLAGSAA